MKILPKSCLILLLTQSAAASVPLEKPIFELPISDFLNYSPDSQLNAIVQHCCEEVHCKYTPYRVYLWRNKFNKFSESLIMCLDGFSCYYSGVLPEDIVKIAENYFSKYNKVLTTRQRHLLINLIEELIGD